MQLVSSWMSGPLLPREKLGSRERSCSNCQSTGQSKSVHDPSKGSCVRGPLGPRVGLDGLLASSTAEIGADA